MWGITFWATYVQ